jgi:hypothetical protein
MGSFLNRMRVARSLLQVVVARPALACAGLPGSYSSCPYLLSLTGVDVA